MKHIVLTGGGTAGHVTPNIAIIPKLNPKNGMKWRPSRNTETPSPYPNDVSVNDFPFSPEYRL